MFRVIFHPKQLMVVSGGDDAEVRVWDLVTKTCMATLKVRAPPAFLVVRCRRNTAGLPFQAG